MVPEPDRGRLRETLFDLNKIDQTIKLLLTKRYPYIMVDRNDDFIAELAARSTQAIRCIYGPSIINGVEIKEGKVCLQLMPINLSTKSHLRLLT